MRPVVLSGFMATGKTSLGKVLAARLGVPFIDTDEQIAQNAKRSVPDLFKEEGEARFRMRERDLVLPLLEDASPKVIAFGGGTVTLPDVRRKALDHAIVITLTASPETIVQRNPDPSARPNLAYPDPLSRARELLVAREEAYAECHLSISTEDVELDECADAICALIDRNPIVVPLGSRTYTIDVATNAPTTLTDAIARLAPSSLLVVSDSNVLRARGEALEEALHPLALDHYSITLAPGERQKNLASVSAIWDAALGHGIDRDAVVLAFGGGVVGDMAGFAGSTLLRGLRVITAPTTLLSMVDASVGGKTGFDHAAGKNLIGSFHQPSAVIVDLAHLATLNPRERNAGLAEMVKLALVHDASLFSALEENAEALAKGDLGTLDGVVRQSIAGKVQIVRDDERESGSRALLNLGHTVGHAIEAAAGYSRWHHGEAVAIGTALELRAMANMGKLDRAVVDRTEALLTRLTLPTSVTRRELETAWPLVFTDKKRAGSAVKLPVVSAVGRATVERVSFAAFKAALFQ